MTRLRIASVALWLASLACSLQKDWKVEGLTQSSPQSHSTRRSFLTQKVPAILGGAGSVALFTNAMGHKVDCDCPQCTSPSSLSYSGHDASCACVTCSGPRRRYGPPAAAAFERDVGGADRSAETAAYNMQAKETNARLERSGFKLDTREEEAARLSDALSSFSYEATPTKKQPAKNGTSSKKSGTTSSK